MFLFTMQYMIRIGRRSEQYKDVLVWIGVFLLVTLLAQILKSLYFNFNHIKRPSLFHAHVVIIIFGTLKKDLSISGQNETAYRCFGAFNNPQTVSLRDGTLGLPLVRSSVCPQNMDLAIKQKLLGLLSWAFLCRLCVLF